MQQPAPKLIDAQPALTALCEKLSQANVIALDTEFIRRDTYYPKLGLIQIALAGDKHQYLIDPVALPDLTPLKAVLLAVKPLKVFHAGSEDLEIFNQHFSGFLEHSRRHKNLFDTQIANACVGGKMQVSLTALVEQYFQISLPGEQTRSNWLQRPLSESQQMYAANDVKYLLPLYDELSGQLKARHRTHWVEDELQSLISQLQQASEFENYYLKIGNHWRLSAKQLFVLKDLCVWREMIARKKNRPRGFIITDDELFELAKTLNPALAGRYAGQCRDLIYVALELFDPGQPSLVSFKPLPRHLKPCLAHIKEQVHDKARQLSILPEFLLGKKLLIQLMRLYLQEAHLQEIQIQETQNFQNWPESLVGWRFEIIIKDILAYLAEEGIREEVEC